MLCNCSLFLLEMLAAGGLIPLLKSGSKIFSLKNELGNEPGKEVTGA